MSYVLDGASIPRILWDFLSPARPSMGAMMTSYEAIKYDQLWQQDEDGNIVPFKQGTGKDYWDESANLDPVNSHSD